MTKLVASVVVEKDGSRVGLLTAEKRTYRQREEVASEVGIRRAWNEDLYLILAGIDDLQGVVRAVEGAGYDVRTETLALEVCGTTV